MEVDTAATGTVERDGKQFRTVTEGKATILVPQGAEIGEDKGEVQQVFYNHIQQFNRDLSVLAIKTYGEETVERKRKAHEASKKAKGKKRKREEAGEETSGEQKSEQPALSNPEAASEVSTASFVPPFKILDALSASGLRALRYGHELPFVTNITANDLSPSAADTIRANVSYNGLDSKIDVTNNDALAIMYRAIADDLSNRNHRGQPDKANKWDVVDLDPYGTGAPFFDAAVQAVRDDGGLLCITCTDSAVWAGHSYCEKTFSLYGGTPIKGAHSHEAGLRLILNSIATSAARYGLEIEPLLSLSIDFYTKFFVRVQKSPHTVKFLGAKTMLVHSCDQGCGSWSTQFLMKSKAAPNKKGSGFFYKHGMAQGPTAEPNCSHCGFKTHINGPMYGGQLHSPDFIRRLLDQIPKADPAIYGTLSRLEGMLNTALEEIAPASESEPTVNPKEDAAAATDPTPFYIDPSRLASILGAPAPPGEMVRGALIHLGYRAARSHCRPGSIKTDASWSTLWWIMTEWLRQRAPSYDASKIKPTSPGYKIVRSFGLVKEDQQNVPGTTTTSTTVPLHAEDKSNGSVIEAGTGEPEPPQASNDPGIVNKEAVNHEEGSSPSPPASLTFNEDIARLGRQEGKRLVRYQANPQKNWGPLNKAQGR